MREMTNDDLFIFTRTMYIFGVWMLHIGHRIRLYLDRTRMAMGIRKNREESHPTMFLTSKFTFPTIISTFLQKISRESSLQIET